MAQGRWPRVSNQSECASTPRHALLHKKREAHRPRYFCPAAEQGQAAQTKSMTHARSACLFSNATHEVLNAEYIDLTHAKLRHNLSRYERNYTESQRADTNTRH